MVFLNECLPNKEEELLTAEEPKVVSGYQLRRLNPMAGNLAHVLKRPNVTALELVHNKSRSLSFAIFIHKGRQNLKAPRVYCTGKIRPEDTKRIFYRCFFSQPAGPLPVGSYRHQKGRTSCQKKQNQATCTGIFSIKPAVSSG